MTADVLLRAASGPAIGAGHVRRTRAVAQAVRELGARPHLFVDDDASAAALRAEGFEAGVDPEWCERSAAGAWLDGFRDWRAELARLGGRRLLVENRTAREASEFVVYPALHWEPDAWDAAHSEQVRGGAPWIPLAREVLDEPAAEREIGCLVTFGGSDPKRLTERVLGALQGWDGRVAVTVGTHMGERRAEIERLAAALPGAEVVAGASNLAPWMARSRAAVTAVATTLYELAYLRVPALVLANYASDRDALAWYGEHGPHQPLGVADELDDAALAESLRSGLVAGARDAPEGLGGGADRIARLLLGENP